MIELRHVKLPFQSFFQLLDRPYMVKRFALVWTLGVATYALHWMLKFAEVQAATPRSGIDIAAIIAAVGGPLYYLVGVVVGLMRPDPADVSQVPPPPQVPLG